MQVTETKKDGLKHEYSVQVDAGSIQQEMDSQLQSMAGRVKIPGFRPGHIPLSVLKQRFGKNVMGDVIERTVSQSTQKVLKEKSLRPALQPKVEITSYEEGSDLAFRMEVEVMPDMPEIDFSQISLDKMICDIDENEVAEAVARLADRNRVFTRAGKGVKAEKGDQLLMDFTGRMDGVAFEGGTAKKFELVLGGGQFIEGFEEQLEGVKEGDTLTVNVTFPKHYHKVELAGKPAEFEVTVHEVRKGEEAKADDALAKKMGFADLDAMRKAVREQFSGDYEAAARARMKKQLFDALEEACAFDIPQGMMDLEFASIWEKLQQARKEGDEALSAKSDDELREEYTRIAERRVKLGILLSDIAHKHKVQVNQDELSRAVMQQAGQFPGQERKIFEFYQKHPQHLEELRGPILEEKAVDFILGKVKVTERKVSRDELMNDEEEDAQPQPRKNAAAKAKKKAASE